MNIPELLKPIDQQLPETTPPTPLADAVRSVNMDRKSSFLDTMEAVAPINPDAYGKATALSRYSGIPAKVLHDNAEYLDKITAGDRYGAIADNYNKTANALRDGNLAAVSQDDLDQLTRIEGAAGDARFNQQSLGEKLWGAVRQAWVSGQQSAAVGKTLNLTGLTQQFDAVDAEIARAERAGEAPYGGQVADAPLQPFAREYLIASPEQRQEMRANLLERQGDVLTGMATRQQQLEAAPLDPGARRAAELQAQGIDSFDATMEALTENPGYAVRTAAGATASSAPMLVAGALGGIPAAAAVEYGTEYDAKLLDVMQEAGVDLKSPKAVLEFLQDDSKVADARTRAARKAAGTTAVDIVSMGLASKLLVPTRLAGRQLSATQREMANLLVQMPVQAVTEGASEAAGQYAADQKIDAGQVLLEAVAGGLSSSTEVASFSYHRIYESFANGLRDARQARIGKQSLDEMVDATVNGKTRGRDPGTFNDIAKAQLADSPMETLWVPAEALTRLNQEGQIDLPKLMEQIPELADQYNDAQARGGNVSMRTADYLTWLSDFHDQIGNGVKINADGMSIDDAKAWTDAQEENIRALADSLAQAPSGERVVMDDIMGQLLSAGFRRQDAEQYAQTHLSVLSNLAERTGQAVEQLAQQFPLNITNEQPVALQAFTEPQVREAITELRTPDPEGQELSPAARQLQPYLEQIGIDLQQATDEQVMDALRQQPAPEGQRLEQFAGPTAWTADTASLSQTQQQIGDGANAEQVRKETGWFQGADGRWRFEIDDSAATFNNVADWIDAAEDGGAPLQDVLNHPALFAAYPEIGRVRVHVNPQRTGGAMFIGEPGRGFVGAVIEIGDPTAYAADTPAIDSVMHEVQHAIQAREGFAPGGDPEVLRAEKDQALADRDYWKQVADLRREIDRAGNADEGRAAYITTFERTPTEQQMQDAQGAELPQIEQRADEAERVMREIGNPEQTYQRLAGEVEARNTAARRTMTAEERRAASPEQTADVASERAIVRWGGTEMNSRAVAQQGAQGQRLNQGGENDQARGFITFSPRGQQDRRFQITLGEKRDLSTVLHELGHYYLEVIQDLSQAQNAPEQLVRDVATIRDWVGATDGEPLTVEQHEQFARGFEAYLAEGKAPSVELAGAFARFKRWLIQIYKDLQRLNVELSEPVRAVFDRLVASDEQITQAEQVTDAIPLFADAERAGMTENEFQRYQDSVAIAHSEAQEDVARQIQGEEDRRRSKFWREEYNRMRELVAEEVDTMPTYAALKALRRGIMPDGSTLDIKLNSGELVERYGADTARRLAFTHSRNGQDLDVVAELLGFSSGDQMVKELLGTPPRAEMIRQETTARMEATHGPKTTGEAADRAIEAVHNEQRAAVLQKELVQLGKQGNRRNVTSQQILKEAARRVMAERKVRDIAPAEFSRAEAKAARDTYAAFVKGDLDTAFEAKQRQLLNFYMYREAVKARQNVESIVDRLSAYNKQSKREKLGKAGQDYLDQIDTALEQYEFRRVSLTELNRRKSFLAWYNDQLAVGNEPFVPEFMLNTTQRVNYKELTLNQLQELDEFVANVNHLATLKNKLLANKRVRDFDEARTQMVDAARKNLTERKAPPIDKNARTAIERIGDAAGDFSAALLKMEQIVEWLDGGDVTGPWSTIFWQPFVDAQTRKDDLNREFAIKMTSLVDAYTRDRGAKVMQQRYDIPSIGGTLTHNAVLAAALNMGNEGNRTKLLNGGHNGKAWTESQLGDIVQHMDGRDWQFVQSMWDLVEELWPSIEALERELHGIPPAKVEAVPVVTQYGTFRGGYWPLVYDTSSSAYAQVQNQLGNEGGLFEQGYAKATTPKGHTKARVDAFAAPILLDVSIVAQHLGQVIHDLTHRTAIRDAAKIIGDRQIKQALIDTLGPAVANQFNPWLQGVANDMVLDSQKGIDAWTKFIGERLRANAAIAWMGFSATTGLQQILGYSQSFEYMAQKGGRRYVLRGMKEFIAHPFNTMEFVRGLSGEMRNREANLDRDMRSVLQQIQGKKGYLQIAQRLAFKHIGIIQSMVDYPTWLAGYHQAMDQGLTSEQAVAAGDRAVRLSQMAAGPKDLAAVQRKDGLMKALTIVYSYFSMMYNRQVDIAKSFKSARSVGDFLNAFERSMFLLVIPAVAGPLISGQGPADDEDWRAWATLKLMTYPLMGIPGLRDVAGAFEKGWGFSSNTPLAPLGDALSKLLGFARKAIEGQEIEADPAQVAGYALDAVGYGFGLPSTQAKRVAKFLIGTSEGDIEPEGVTDWIRGIMFGPPKD